MSANNLISLINDNVFILRDIRYCQNEYELILYTRINILTYLRSVFNVINCIKLYKLICSHIVNIILFVCICTNIIITVTA